MAGFDTPTDLMNNGGLISDPESFAREKGADADGAAFFQSDELRAWVADGLEPLS